MHKLVGRTLFGGLVVAVLGFASATPASAEYIPGTPWSSCSAPLDCAGTRYVRRIHPLRAVVVHRHARIVRKAPAVRRPVRHAAVHRTTVNTGSYVQGTFQTITDPREAAVTAWADIVNARQ
jgi:hypothetical protein